MVEGGVSNGEKNKFSTQPHRVHMRYASAVPVGVYMNEISRPANHEQLELYCQTKVNDIVCFAQLHAILTDAVAKGKAKESKQRVFCMPMGTGAFSRDDMKESAFTRYDSLAARGQQIPGIKDHVEVLVLGWSGNLAEIDNLQSNLARLQGPTRSRNMSEIRVGNQSNTQPAADN